MTFLMIIVGLALLLGGGDILVRGSVALAVRLGIPTLVIGVTLVGFGTSLPELVASVQAALRDAPGIAVGNIVGSNIANILLILGLAAIILPMVGTPIRRRDAVALGLATLALIVVIEIGYLGRTAGAVFLVALAGYMALTFLRNGEDEVEEPLPGKGLRTPLAILFAVAGIAAVIVGADLLVDGGIAVAASLGVPEAVIGLTIVAVGTSLPELATAVVAAMHRQPDVVLGNVVGSNIFNVFAIAGITALVQPLDVPDEIRMFDVWVMLGATLLLIVFSMTVGIGRILGALLLAGYAAYVTVQFVG